MVATVLGRVLRTGIRRGVVEGSRSWTVAGTAAGVVLLARWIHQRPAPVVARQVLRPGESLTVTLREPDGAPPLLRETP
jgi:hypothetical protein